MPPIKPDSVRNSPKVKPDRKFPSGLALIIMCALSRRQTRTAFDLQTIIARGAGVSIAASWLNRILYNLKDLGYVETDTQHKAGREQTYFALTNPGTLHRNWALESLTQILGLSGDMGGSL